MEHISTDVHTVCSRIDYTQTAERDVFGEPIESILGSDSQRADDECSEIDEESPHYIHAANNQHS